METQICPKCNSNDIEVMFLKNEGGNDVIYCHECNDITGYLCPECKTPLKYLTYDKCPKCGNENL